MNKLFFLLFITALLSPSASAKKDSTAVKRDYKNSFFVSAMGQSFPKTYKYSSNVPVILSGDFADIYSIYYERKIYKNWGLGTGYTIWNPFPGQLADVYPDGEEIWDGPLREQIRKGTIEYLQKYKMLDLYVNYKYNKFKKHKIEAGVGLSYDWGTNTIIDTIYVLPYDDVVIAHQQPAHYYGVVAFISYDYLCFHRRIAIGYTFKWRRYYGLYSPQIDYGVNIKFNFA